MFRLKWVYHSVATLAVVVGAIVFAPFMAAAQNMKGMPGMAMPSDPAMNPLGVSMDRMGSGTTWIPDALAIPSVQFSAADWHLALHGFAFGQYDMQSGPRGGNQLGSLNWAMLMATRAVAGGRFQARAMLSLDAATLRDGGYPLLLQTGETWKGKPLIDRQHPHDFWMELGLQYERELTRDVGFSVYVAPSGEPALGPVAFMHRPSAMDNPEAGIGHHWQDATHVSFGVVTAGIFSRRWKLEGSVFNGQEPDENRWNFDFHPLQSYSGRVTFNPDSSWSMSAGYGFIKEPEASDAGHSMHRTSIALQHSRRLGMAGQWATTLIWGANAHADEEGLSQSILAESEAILDERNTVFGRAEYVQKPAEDLGITGTALTAADHGRFGVSRLSLGYIREIGTFGAATIGLGAVGSVNFVPSALERTYGSSTPTGATLFVRLRARIVPQHNMHDMHNMEMPK